MENQHRLIKGYRELTQDEINMMNTAKEFEESILRFMEHVAVVVSPDERWLAIAKTNLQQGFMALGRSIARPDGY